MAGVRRTRLFWLRGVGNEMTSFEQEMRTETDKLERLMRAADAALRTRRRQLYGRITVWGAVAAFAWYWFQAFAALVNRLV